MKSIRMQNFITIAVILLLCFILLGASFSVVSYQYVRQERMQALEKDAEYVTAAVSAYSRAWELDGFDMRIFLVSTSSISGEDILLCLPDGTVASCSDRLIACPHIGRQVSEGVISAIEDQGSYRITGTLGGLYAERRYVYGTAVNSEITGRPVCYVFLSAESESVTQIWRQFAVRFLMVAGLVLVLAFLLSLLTSRRQTKPINDIAAAANRFARGDFSARVQVETGRRDEIADLADSFNAMADSLERGETLRHEFIANVSHELKTPLTTITGFSDGILDGTIPPEKQGEYLSVVSSEARRMSRLVRSMLDMSQLQSMDSSAILQKSFDVSEVVMETLLGLEKKINDKGLDVSPQLPEESVVVRGDRDAITQVVYNLIDNAVKFARTGTTLRIELWKQGEKAFVSVENTGETIPEAELPLIFDRFHKTDRSRSMDRDGVGLGLYIVKTILDNHNENIYVTSRDGVTRFVFSLTVKA